VPPQIHRTFEVQAASSRRGAGPSQGVMDRLAVGGQPERLDRLAYAS
jgi:hypothetical protein